MRELTVRLVMLSDWHVGSGTGRHGLLDRAVQRDRSGLPYVPAKTLTGVWRDACERAAAALDGGAPAGRWRAWVEYLFGGQPALEEPGVPKNADGRGPRPAALRVGSAHCPPAVAAALAGRPRLAASAVFLKPGVRLDAETGAAAQEMLRFEEMGRCGAVLYGTAALPGVDKLDGDGRKVADALLAAGAGLIESLGGKRRRGAGRCRLELEAEDMAVDWAWLATGPAIPAPPDVTVTPAVPAVPTDVRSQAGVAADAEREPWEVADLRLVLEQPVVAHERTVGNAVRGMDHVPGWMLLPAVLERLAAPGAAEAARRGHLVVTHALPEVDGRPGRPVPRCLVHAKDDPFDQRNLLAERPEPRFEEFGAGYVGEYAVGTAVRVWQCPRTDHTHNTVDDAVQRPTERVGGLYTYQAIAEGTVLRAQVRAAAGVLPAGWAGRLGGVWHIGRSRKDGYGRVRVEAAPTAGPDPHPMPHGRLRVWLLSDVLIHDARLRASTNPYDLAAVLGRELGVRLAPAEGQVVAARRLDPWHRRWGLPRHSLVGLSAGGCLEFGVLEGRLDPGAVARVETTGVGLRRAEGFGQVLIGDPLLDAELGGAAVPELANEPGSSDLVPGEPGQTPNSDAKDTAVWLGPIVRAAWREEIHRVAEALASDPDRRAKVLGPGHQAVPPSQFGALRTLVHPLSAPDEPRVRVWLKGLGDTDIRNRAWPDTVRERLEALLTAPDKVWDLLSLPEESLTTDGMPALEVRRVLWPEAVRALVEDCLTAHARAKHQRGEG
ncbi:RAMP superfamily CRISPR-associated protein [Streptomyces albogriseolus]|uniref:RAMP superfamily CRISPR-associated protein n=1 Tax=Streptomyces albogriseolus TaxID=1887 RepID=UPI003CF5651A